MTKNITITNLKGTLDYFAEKYFGKGTKTRLRPHHFQFTEPSFEVDISCNNCGGTGTVGALRAMPVHRLQGLLNPVG